MSLSDRTNQLNDAADKRHAEQLKAQKAAETAATKAVPTREQRLETYVRAVEHAAAEAKKRAHSESEDPRIVTQALILERRAQKMRTLLDEHKAEGAILAIKGGDTHGKLREAARPIADKLIKLIPCAGKPKAMSLAMQYGDFVELRRQCAIALQNANPSCLRATNRQTATAKEITRLVELTAQEVHGGREPQNMDNLLAPVLK